MPGRGAAALHGEAVPRGLDAVAGTGRFGEMFPERDACDPSDAAIDALVAIMGQHDPAPTNRRIPSGFTYLGQFIDHDITFDPVSKFDRAADPHALENFRTPRLDLDSVYGAGPVVQPYLYDMEAKPEGARMLVDAAGPVLDLPRNDQGRALIGDARNDENAIVSQLHLLFLRFHNAVVEHLSATVDEDDLFEEARRSVRDHYRWIVVHEFLPAVTGIAEPVPLDHFDAGDAVFIPIEFSGAAYRFGHSMVRAQYGLRRLVPGGPTPHGTPLFPDLRGLGPLDPAHQIDWERFFPFPGIEREAQPSQKINTHIPRPLLNLPLGEPSLPRRNLLRGRSLGLPSGQVVCKLMSEPLLADEELHLDAVPAAPVRGELREAAPLWFYLLCEAETRAAGEHLGPTGGRIVAEVLGWLLAADPTYDPDWRPGELGTGDEFTMATLATFARG